MHVSYEARIIQNIFYENIILCICIDTYILYIYIISLMSYDIIRTYIYKYHMIWYIMNATGSKIRF